MQTQQKSAPGHVMPNFCVCIRLDLRVMFCILVRLGREMSMHYFHAQVGLVRIRQKAWRDMLR
jgi:hypothetical protein